MHKPEQKSDWVDRYMRNGLTTEEEAVFETALLDSPDLQLQLETALGIRQAVIYGSVMASFNVESFSLDRLRQLAPKTIHARYKEFKRLTHFENI